MIRIITDSASDISREFAEENQMEIVPLLVRIGETEYRDGVDLSGKEFFLKLIESDELPKTSQATPFAFMECFEKYETDEVICITLSSKLSGTYQSAVLAAQSFPNVTVIDSLNVTIGERLLILQAIRRIKEGKSKQEIVQELLEIRKNIRLIALLDTLEYLKKGGRISTLSYTFGSILNIKPVIEIQDGCVAVTGRARGSKNGNNILREKTKEYGIDFEMPYALAYSGLSDALLWKYIQDSRDIYEDHPLEDISLIGSTIGTHIGPGGIALAFFKK